jgi:hypothetical protein
LVLAGNDPLHTVEALNANYAETPYVVLEDGKAEGDGMRSGGR